MMTCKIISLFAMGLFLLAGVVLAEPINNIPPSQTIFKRGLAEVKEYRIPSLLSTPEGTLIAMVDARKDRPGDIPNNVDIAIRRSTDYGKTWGKVQIIVDYGPKPKGYDVHWGAADAAMVYDAQTKTIWCLYTLGQGVGIRQSRPGLDGHTCQIHAIYSRDNGRTWSKPRDISPQCKRPSMKFFGTAPGVGIQTRDGKLVFCIYTTEEGKKPMVPYLIISGDHGKTWRLSNTWSDGKTSVTEAQIIELPDGTWLVNSRNHHGKARRLISTTKDQGKTWSDFTFDDALLCPTCMASLISINDPRFSDQSDRKLLVFANPASVKGRKQGTVRVSEDGGKSWKWSKLVKSGGYAYSCLTRLNDGSLGLFYEAGGGELSFMQITLEWLTDGDIVVKK